MDNDKVLALTKEQAASCLAVSNGKVHCFLSSPIGLVGADWDLESVNDLMDKVAASFHIQIAGEQAKAMNHAITVFDTTYGHWCFFECDMEKIAEMETAMTFH